MLGNLRAADASSAFADLVDAAGGIILGKDVEIRLAFACILAGGHLLIEDLPGVGKTTLAQLLARLLGLDYSRIQFTSDMLPADVIGVSVFDRASEQFRFHPGPIFSQLVLADEINRATPKAQSALLEAMEERQVTAEGQTRALPEPFFVIATQNPSYQVGTFPLPESQLDRFLMRIELGYPGADQEKMLLAGEDRRALLATLRSVVTPTLLIHAQRRVPDVHASSAIIDYCLAILQFSRNGNRFLHGLSPRAGLGLLRAAKAWAFMDQRDFVLPEDVQQVLPAVAPHRLVSGDDDSPAGHAEIAERILDAVPIPVTDAALVTTERRGARSWPASLTRTNPCDAEGIATIDARRIYILPTRAGLAYGAMLLATLVGSLNYQNNLGLFFTFLMASVALVSMHHCWFNLLGLRISARDALPVFCGQQAHFVIEVADGRGKARGEVCVRAGDCRAVSAGASSEIGLEVETPQRGVMRLEEIEIETRHPLGLFRAWAPVQVVATALVYPRPALRAPAPRAADALEHKAKGDHGVGADDFVGLRPYRPGDSPRQLDWKAFAAARGLVIKVFGGDHAARVWLDFQALSGGREERLCALARQVLDAHEQQVVFGMRLPGQAIECDRGDRHKHRCLEALARQPSDETARPPAGDTRGH